MCHPNWHHIDISKFATCHLAQKIKINFLFKIYGCGGLSSRNVICIWYIVRVSETLFTVATWKLERIEGNCGFEGTSFQLLLLLNLKETFSEPKISKYFKHSKKKKLKNEKKKNFLTNSIKIVIILILK